MSRQVSPLLALTELPVSVGCPRELSPRSFPSFCNLKTVESGVTFDDSSFSISKNSQQLSPGFNNLLSISNAHVCHITSFLLGQVLFSSWGSSDPDLALGMSMELSFRLLHGEREAKGVGLGLQDPAFE